jgi:hypothetical protein
MINSKCLKFTLKSCNRPKCSKQEKNYPASEKKRVLWGSPVHSFHSEWNPEWCHMYPVPRRLFIASESVTLTIRMIRVIQSVWTQWQIPAFGSRNPWTQRYLWRSVHGIRERNESSGVRSTESVDATRVLAFGPRKPWTQREFWRSVHGIRGRNESYGFRSTESVYITPANYKYNPAMVIGKYARA